MLVGDTSGECWSGLGMNLGCEKGGGVCRPGRAKGGNGHSFAVGAQHGACDPMYGLVSLLGERSPDY